MRQATRRGKGYVRVSAIMGREELMSPEIQIDAIQRLAAREDIELVGVVQDLDQSGKDFAKRSISAMLQEVRRGDYEYVLLWKWSRFGRNLRSSLINLHDLEKVGGEALSATEPGDGKTTMGRYSRNQMLGLAELQADMLGDGWREAHAIRLRQGLPHGGVPGFGYIKVGRNFFPDPVIGEAVAEVYERFVADEPLRTIVLDMRALGVRAANGAVIDNSRWIRIMESGFAAGLIRKRIAGSTSRRFDQWVWHPGAHEAVISMELWEAFKRKRMGTLGRNWASTKSKYSLSGMITCGNCLVRKITANGKLNDGADVMFRCPGIPLGECKGVSGILRLGENAVLNWIVEKERNVSKINDAARRQSARQVKRNEIDQLEKTVEELKGRLIRLLDVYESGELDKATYINRKHQREKELYEAERALEGMQGDRPRELPVSFFSDLREAWPDLHPDKKRQMLKMVIREIILHPVGHPGGRWEIVPFQNA